MKLKNPISLKSKKHESILYITPDFMICFCHKKPNWWFRFWYKVLLNWNWRDMTDSFTYSTPESSIKWDSSINGTGKYKIMQ